MLRHPTLDKLNNMRLLGMAHSLQRQIDQDDCRQLSFDDRFGLLVDAEHDDRINKRLKTRLRMARLRQQACIEDIDYRTPRQLDKALVQQLAGCQWINEHYNCLITGSTGLMT